MAEKKEKLTQHELVIHWVKEHGYIVPARMGGLIYKGQMLGSELPRRCRELCRDSYGCLLKRSRWAEDEKFIVFYPTDNFAKLSNNDMTIARELKKSAHAKQVALFNISVRG
jgi:hypothetical protein